MADPNGQTTATVTLPSGDTATVDLASIALPEGHSILTPGTTPEGFVSKTYMESEMQRRGADTAKIKAKLKGDAEFLREVYSGHGLEVGEDGTPVLPKQVDLDAHRAKWEESQLTPVKAKLDTLTSRLTSAALREALGGKVKDEFLAPAPGGKPSYAETLFAQHVGFDPETGQVLGKVGEAFAPGSQSAYAPAAEHIATLLQQPGYAHLLKGDEKQSGPGFKGASTQGGKTSSQRYKELSSQL